jgi:hypothetical protein
MATSFAARVEYNPWHPKAHQLRLAGLGGWLAGSEIIKEPGLGYANETVDVPTDGMTYDIVLSPAYTPR